ncbi:MAG: protein kinase [Anaerolineae bacterium]|nr:protein kinase [Anaerolineae bacterium]
MQPGYRIEHYVVIEKIGQGGQAAVWSAYDERLKRTVAIKTIGLIRVDDADSAETLPANVSSLTNPDRFREEAQIIAALEHPNILPVYAFGQEGEYLYIVMRYMAAGSLKDLLKHDRLDLNGALTLMEPLANALDLAHANQIIHRDLKSANILLDSHLHPYLADFGLSMTIGDKNSLAGVGTLAYMSPEQMTGDPLDERSDLYSFGILLYETLVGHLPNINGQPWNLQQAMLNTPLPIPDDLPPGVADILRKATAREPADRYENASRIIADLRMVLAPKMRRTQTTEQPAPVTDPIMLALLEAHDLFDKAMERWSDGAGKFRLESGDFKYIDSYFREPEVWDIYLTEVAKRFLLRAALEHGYNLEHWWGQVTDVAEQRAVALQTLNSDVASARQRAIQRLMTIPDSDPPAIPIRVANVIKDEPDPAVRLAGITLLETRATSSRAWRPVAYDETIDGILADLAIRDLNGKVAEAAARTSARMRSTLVMTRLAERAPQNLQAFKALVDAREEVMSLPASVPPILRQRVFWALTRRQLFSDPFGLAGRYLGAAFGFGIGLGVIVYINFNDAGGLLSAQQFGNALAVGALYGALVGLGILAATEPAQRLRAWTLPGRIALSLAAGMLLTTVAFAIFQLYFMYWKITDWLWLLFQSLVFVAGFALASGLTRRTWLRSAAGAASVLIGLYLVSWQIGYYAGKDPLIFLREGQDDQSLLLSMIVAIALGVLAFAPEWIRAFRKRLRTQTG